MWRERTTGETKHEEGTLVRTIGVDLRESRECMLVQSLIRVRLASRLISCVTTTRVVIFLLARIELQIILKTLYCVLHDPSRRYHSRQCEAHMIETVYRLSI